MREFLIKYFALGAGIVAIIFLSVFIYYAKDLPSTDKIYDRQITESTKIYDRTGKVLLYDIHGEEKRTIVNLDQISPYLKQATIVTEDAEFYNHIGINLRAIARAVWADLTGSSLSQGGSTITQQFIKKSFLTDDKKFSRKIKEAVLALELERRYSKDEILNLYLNQIPYGSNAYGIEAASQTFFNKSAKDLTLAESALLAALPQAPSRLSPYGSHPEELKARQEYVLDRMVKYNYVSKDQAEQAKKEPLNFNTQPHNINAPHFVMYVKEYLEDKYDKDYIEKSGLKVYTTLDWELQSAAEKIVKESAESNAKKYQAYNAALTAIDPKTGQILAMVGSRDYNAEESLPAGCTPGKNCKFEPNVNVTIRDRQPGSSFKPFAYVTAFEKGYTPDTVLFDLTTEFNEKCSAAATDEKDPNGLDCYHPGNYDDKTRGPVTMRSALAQSLNIPAVQTLYLAGIDRTIKTAKNMGITSLNGDYYGLSLVLGGGEVKLLDEVAAYGVFANDGIKNEKTPILKIEDANGKIIEEYEHKPKQIIGSQYARLISDVLSDNPARTPEFGANSPLYLPERPIAAKTGTTQKYRDAWTLGYTPSLAVGVWTGNNDNTPMSKAGAGIAAAGPIWNSFFKKAYELKATDTCSNQDNNFCLPKEIENFTKPEPIQTNKAMLNGNYISVRTYKVDKISGALATDQTPPDLIQEAQYKEVHNILYYVKKDDPQGDSPENPGDDPMFHNWEYPVQIWLAAHGGGFNLLPPDEKDDLHTEKNLPQVNITYPSSNSFVSGNTFTATANASASLGLKQIDFFLDDEFVGSVLSPPYQIKITLPDFSKGSHTLKARAYDTALNRQEDQVIFYATNQFINW